MSNPAHGPSCICPVCRGVSGKRSREVSERLNKQTVENNIHMAGNPAEKLHVIIRQFDKDGCPSVVSEYETVTIGKVLEYVYAFSIGKHENATRMTIDISYPTPIVTAGETVRGGV